MVNVLGKGFIGGRYCELTPYVIVNDRNNYNVQSKNVLYFISTVDNYNVHTDPFVDIDTNLTTLIKTLQSCNEDTTFNFISSWFVYGNTELPAKETSACNPTGFYSITKRAAEQLLISYCETKGIKYRILRLANVVGSQDKKVSKKKSALQYMVNQVLNNEDVTLYDGGTLCRDYIHVDDVVQAINLVIENGPVNEITNIGNGVPIAIRDAIEYAIKVTGSKSKLLNIEVPLFHKIVQTRDMVLDITKIKELGYIPRYNIHKIIDSLVLNPTN
jgi:nucleoside-diphosphate-sugar epimerase